MNIDEIETFVAIAALGSFTRAGERLHRTQPAISRRQGLLEQELGAPLFERIRGDARLTEAGRAFLPHAEAALAALKDGREAVLGLQAGLRGAVSVALVGTIADTHIIGVLRQFARDAGDVQLKLRTASSSEVTDLVRRGEATLGLRYFSSDRSDLIAHEAGSEAMLVVAEPGHHLATHSVTDTSVLAGERWIGFPPTRDGRVSSGHVLVRQLIRAGARKQRTGRIAPRRAGSFGHSCNADLHPNHRHSPAERLPQPGRQGVAGAADGAGRVIGGAGRVGDCFSCYHSYKRYFKYTL